MENIVEKYKIRCQDLSNELLTLVPIDFVKDKIYHQYDGGTFICKRLK